MQLDLIFFLFAIPAVMFAGISKGGFGSGAAFAATPLLALIIEPAAAVGLMLPLLLLMDVGALKPYWRKWDAKVAKLLIFGSIPGIVLGAILFGVADPNVFKVLIGVVAIGFVLFQLVLKFGVLTLEGRNLPDAAGYFAGAVAGLTSFISHAGGPPASVFMLARSMDKTTYQATTVIVFWLINIFKFVPYIAMGIISLSMWKAWILLAPFALVGVWLGVKAHFLIPEKLFFAFVYVFLFVTGSKLILDAM